MFFFNGLNTNQNFKIRGKFNSSARKEFLCCDLELSPNMSI